MYIISQARLLAFLRESGMFPQQTCSTSPTFAGSGHLLDITLVQLQLFLCPDAKHARLSH